MMKKFVSVAMLAAMGVAMIGCSASVDTTPDHSASNSSSYDKQTTVTQHPDGSVDKTVKTTNNP